MPAAGSPDLVAHLGSRGTVPGEVRSRWGIADYVALTARPPGRGDIDAELRETAYGPARALRRLDPERLLAVLRALARPPSAELNKARLAAAAGIPATTAPAYVAVAERLGLVRLLPGTRAVVARRAIARPRVVFDDPAVARHLSGAAVDELGELDARRRLAPLLAGVAAVELLGQQAASATGFRVGHLRERNGLAVDLVVELPDSTVYGIEVRTATGFRPHQFRALEALEARAGRLFRGGVVLNTGAAGFRYRRGMWGLPLSALWEWDTGTPR